MKPAPAGYNIHREQVARYFYWAQVLGIGVLGAVAGFGVGVVLAPLYAWAIGTWLPKRQADAEHYWLDGGSLRINQGVYFLQQRAIPLDRVTDIQLVQGPLQRWCGIWALQIRTTGSAPSHVVLYGLVNPEEIRNELLAARDMAAARRSF